MGVPEVNEGVVHLPGCIPAHPDVRVSPPRGIKRPDVVTAEKSDTAVHAHHVAVKAEDVSRVHDLRGPRKGAEVEPVYSIREPLERGWYEHVGQPVEDHVDRD